VADGTAGTAAASLIKYLVFNKDPKLANEPCVKLRRLSAPFQTQGKTRGTRRGNGRLPGRPKGRGKVPGSQQEKNYRTEVRLICSPIR